MDNINLMHSATEENNSGNASTNTNDDCMLTTYDNPFNPFTEFNLWFKHDLLLGHNCCGLLSQVANVNNIQSDYYNQKDVNDAIDYICEQFPLIFKKVHRSDYEKEQKTD